MPDKSYTPASGETFQVKRGPGATLEVQKEGAKEKASFPAAVETTAIDSQTARLHADHGHCRNLFWVYGRGSKRVVSWPGGSIELDASEIAAVGAGSAGTLKPLKLTMPGKVLAVNVAEGDAVEVGQALVIVEAMKMENILLSPTKARIGKLHIQAGDRLESGATLITFEALEQK